MNNDKQDEKTTTEQVEEIIENNENNSNDVITKIIEDEVQNDEIIKEYNFDYFVKNELNSKDLDSFKETFERIFSENLAETTSELSPQTKSKFVRIASHDVSDDYHLTMIYTGSDELLDKIIDANPTEVVVCSSLSVQQWVVILQTLRTFLTRQIIFYTDDDFKKHMPLGDFKNLVILNAGVKNG